MLTDAHSSHRQDGVSSAQYFYKDMFHTDYMWALKCKLVRGENEEEA